MQFPKVFEACKSAIATKDNVTEINKQYIISLTDIFSNKIVPGFGE